MSGQITTDNKVVVSCSWCVENEAEIQAAQKRIQQLQRRISEIKQDMECCSCNNQQNKSTDMKPSTNVLAAGPAIKVENPFFISEIEQIPQLHPSQGGVQFGTSATSAVGSKRKAADPISKDGNQGKAPRIISTLTPATAATTSTNTNTSGGGSSSGGSFTYKCMKQFNCPASFRTFPEMSAHLADVHGWAKFAPSCSICGQIFKNRDEKFQHKKLAHGSSCSVCSATFKNDKGLHHHLKFKHNLSPPSLPCTECAQTFESGDLLLKHLALHEQMNPGRKLLVRCEHCKTSFLNQADKDDHVANKHRNECRTCGDVFPSFELMIGHRWNAHGIAPDKGSSGGQKNMKNWRKGKKKH